MSNLVVHHLARPAAVFREVSRVLAPGGRFAFVVWAAPEEQTGFGVFFAAGTSGPVGGIVAGLTPESIRATAFGTFTSVNNVLGLAAGSFVIGLLADRTGLVDAMRVAPLVSVLAIAVLLAGRRTYAGSLATAELVGAK